MTNRHKTWVRMTIASMLWLASSNWAHATVNRGNLTLDDGVTVVVVDSTATTWTAAEIATLVLGADRSTQDDCMWVRATKGLFQTGDRIFVNYNYLAWISASSGTIRGLWALNAATKNFRDYRTGPEGCFWAHNQLIPGSASPQGQLFHWDQHAPPIEHSINFQATPSLVVGVSHAYAFRTPSGNVQALYDGIEIPEGVMYATGVRMAAFIGTGYTVDVYDGNEANGIQNWVDSNLAFIFRPTDIRVIWQFTPKYYAITPFNVIYWLWLNYSFDQDGQTCDTLPGDNWPGTWWGEPRYFQSNRLSWDGVSGTTDVAASTIVGPLSRGTPCGGSPGRYIHGAAANGDWVLFGEGATLAPGTPRIRLSHEVDAGWGTPLTWDFFGVANEGFDGVWGMGGQRFSFVSPMTFAAATPYTTSYVLSLQ